MDFEALLKKYVRHVGSIEGTYFIENGGYLGLDRFTQKEVEYLIQLEKDLTKRPPGAIPFRRI